MTNAVTQRVGIAGFGTVGREVCAVLSAGIHGLTLTAVAVRDVAESIDSLATLGIRDLVTSSFEELAECVDIVVECAPAALLRQIAEPILKRGRTLVVLSAGALLEMPDLIKLAKSKGGRILVPSGSILGLDAICAAAEGRIESIRMVTRKPPASLAGAPYLVDQGNKLERLTAPLRVFCGTPREAAIGFPANVNVAAAVYLAGAGAKSMKFEIWADPTILRNMHSLEIECDSGRLSMTIENIASANPRTSSIAARSLVALLRKLHAPLAIGT
ncbi:MULTISPECIES: aspartate dehydrogenase [unclassified Aurantimonas]|uniref:aspartate dehydrogenase n=1 Tax=unclassified Aurantimonas TaxID=2638230 RepID=UPI002E1781EF|nr:MULTISPECIES: aspartate dehydrogenase [unclassified Aurantimonas]MEC5292794.1 aspartate dehydrogenase [Aurantimonas sp. C2-3-R2]MEC5413846.1 aspartate dehydrogenase [Aurantimonas sp. C2-4-R8]